MTTIVTDQPSTGKPVPIRSALISDAGPVVLVEANDFAVPPIDDTENPDVPTRTINGILRQIVGGELLFVTPLTVTNLTSASGTIRLSIKDESGSSYYLTHAITIPGNETVELPVQGKSLLKINAGSLGEQMIVEVSSGAQFAVYAMGSEAQVGSHAYDTEGTI